MKENVKIFHDTERKWGEYMLILPKSSERYLLATASKNPPVP
jgi:hypothetical protein